MKIFENTNTASYTYPIEKQKEFTHPVSLELYKRVGKSSSTIGWGWRLARTVQLIGLLATGILLFPFAAYRKSLKHVFNEVSTGKEKNIHYIPFQEKTSSEQLTMLDNLGNSIKSNLSSLNNGPYQSAACYILLDGNKGQIKKQFILKSPTGDEAGLFQEFAKMKEKLKDQLNSNIGNAIEFKCQAIFKNKAGHLSSADYSCKNSRSGSGGAVTGISSATVKRIHDEMGFPKVVHYKNGDFVPGPLYEALK